MNVLQEVQIQSMKNDPMIYKWRWHKIGYIIGLLSKSYLQ